MVYVWRITQPMYLNGSDCMECTDTKKRPIYPIGLVCVSEWNEIRFSFSFFFELIVLCDVNARQE